MGTIKLKYILGFKSADLAQVLWILLHNVCGHFKKPGSCLSNLNLNFQILDLKI